MKNVFGIFIGIEDYFDKGVLKVQYAADDAKAVHDAFIGLGCPKENLSLLNSNKITYVTIISQFKKLLKRVERDSIVVFFFGGHGYRRSGKNYITAVDSTRDDVDETCILMNTIYQLLEESKSEKHIIFLDCCHSGIPISDVSRDDFGVFVPEEYEKSYSVTFAACDKDELSYVCEDFKHGIWTNYLLEALTGKAPTEFYKEGRLFSTQLQEFLRKNVPETAYRYFKKPQLPQKFGVESHGEFQVADLSKLFLEREKVRLIEDFDAVGVSIKGVRTGSVKSLSGYPKTGNWKAPNVVNEYFNKQVKEFGDDLVKEHRDEIYNKLDMDANMYEDIGVAWFKCDSFEYIYLVMQSPNRPTDYVLENILEICSDDFYKMINPDFVKAIDDNFRFVRFNRNKNIDLGRLSALMKANNLKPKEKHRSEKVIAIELDLSALNASIKLEDDHIFIDFAYEKNIQEVLNKSKEILGILQKCVPEKLLK
jgi:hypothetical protein